MEALAITVISAATVIPVAALILRAIARLPTFPAVEASVIAIFASVAAVSIAEVRDSTLPPWVVIVTMIAWIAFLLIFPSGRPVGAGLTVVAAAAALALLATGIAEPLQPIGSLSFILAFATLCAGQMWRYARRSSIAERQSTKWLMLGLLPAIGVFLGVGVISLLPAADQAVFAQPWYLAASTGAMWLVPIAATAGILLQDKGPIDELIRVGIALTGTILATAAAYTAVLGFAGDAWATVAGCAAVLPSAWLFLRAGTRLAYSRGPQRPLGTLPARLAASPDPHHVAGSVADTVRSALGVPFAGVLVGGEILASTGTQGETTERIGVDFDGVPVAEILVSPRASETSLTRRDHRILDEITLVAAPALRGAYAAREAADARARLETARTDERRRLHADLHDELGPALAGLGFTATAASRTLDGGSREAERMLTSIQTGIQALVRRVREIAYDLRAEELAGSRLEAILEERLRTADDPLRVSFECEPVPDLLLPDILRIVQEGVTNVRRHAAAESCEVSVRVDDQHRVRITVTDDGNGAAADSRAGIGHASIRHRAEEHGGWMDFVSSPTGSRLVAVLSGERARRA